MELFEVYDVTKSYVQTANLCGVDPKTVRKAIAEREAGNDTNTRKTRDTSYAPFVEKIIEWVERSSGKVRADVVHRKLLAMGYEGSERTTRRIVNLSKASYNHNNHRVYKPWIPEPGMWLQYDFGDGPKIDGQATVLFCAWLAWSRFRVILALRDRTMTSVIGALDRTFRTLGGVTTYVLTDNEKTVSTAHVANVAIRNQTMVSAANYYRFTLATCVPYDPESKGGSESTVKISKADIVPSETNLLEQYKSFDELTEACLVATNRFNSRIHSVTKRTPNELLEIEVKSLHSVPKEPYQGAFGTTRAVSWSSTVSYLGARYSVPHEYVGEKTWVRTSDNELIICVRGKDDTTKEIARHLLVEPGQTSIRDEHYPPRPSSPTDRPPRASSASEAAFLAIGHGASRWLIEAGAVGARLIPMKMAEAVELVDTYGTAEVDEALSTAAMLHRLGVGDLLSILRSRSAPQLREGPEGSLQTGTSVWGGFGK